MTRRFLSFLMLGMIALSTASLLGAEKIEGLDKSGAPELKSIGALTFGPEGVLFVADPANATLYAIGVPAAEKQAVTSFKVEGIEKKIAQEFELKPSDITIVDLAVQPDTGVAYLSINNTSANKPLLVTVTHDGKIAPVDLSKSSYARMPIANAPEAAAKDRRGNSLRQQSITDLAYVDARVYMTGLSKEDATSTMRVVEFPFTSEDTSTEIEIYHGAHGKYETGAPVRTFVPLMFGGEPHLLAAYTCTPLVKLPIADLTKGEKVRGTTVAELGNRNQPIDIIAYQQGKQHYLLLANSARGVMKITTENLEKQPGITEKIADTAGLKYETVSSLQGVMQLDKLGESHALVLRKNASNGYDLESIELP